MLSKATIKAINALKIKKYRQLHHKFIAEGSKIVQEMLHSSTHRLHHVFATEDWYAAHASELGAHAAVTEVVTPTELKKLSTLTTPNQVLAVAEWEDNHHSSQDYTRDLTLVLDGIQDPGNFGTILRIADWFGIPNVVASTQSVDVYNPKVIQASMGAFLRVKVAYTELPAFLREHYKIPIYGAVLGGGNLFRTNLQTPSFIVIGNEGKGISRPVLEQVTFPIEIPRNGGAESLNAAMATSIICAAFRNL